MHAGKDSSPDAREAFGKLYRAYLSPLRGYLSSTGRKDEAEDLTEGFFEHLLEKGGLGKARPTGRFRSWLLASLKNYVRDNWDKKRTQKRGGRQQQVSLDGREGNEPETDVQPRHSSRSPDEEYAYNFAICFVESVLGALQTEYDLKGKEPLFKALHPLLLDKKGLLSQAELGRRLGMTEVAVNTAVSRLRERFRAIFDRELLKLIGSPEELEDERRFLLASLCK